MWLNEVHELESCKINSRNVQIIDKTEFLDKTGISSIVTFLWYDRGFLTHFKPDGLDTIFCISSLLQH